MAKFFATILYVIFVLIAIIMLAPIVGLGFIGLFLWSPSLAVLASLFSILVMLMWVSKHRYRSKT